MRYLICLTLLLCFFCPVQAEEGKSLFVEFIEWALFSRKSYGKYIEVKSYLLDRDQVAQLIADPTKPPEQKTQATLIEQPQYLVFKVAFQKRHFPWEGSIAFRLNGRYLLTTELSDLAITEKQEPPEYFVVPIGKTLSKAIDEPPRIQHRWRTLYVQ